MNFVLPEAPSQWGWTIRQALDEVATGKTLATLALPDREHAYQVALAQWEEAGSPRHSIDPALYVSRGMFPRWTLDPQGMHRRIAPGEWPPNEALMQVAYALVYLEMGRVYKLREAFLSRELLAAGAQGHPGNRIVWLSAQVWGYYAPNVPTNEARWSRVGEIGRTEISPYIEIFELQRGKDPTTFIDNTYFDLRIFTSAEVEALGPTPADISTDHVIVEATASAASPPSPAGDTGAVASPGLQSEKSIEEQVMLTLDALHNERKIDPKSREYGAKKDVEDLVLERLKLGERQRSSVRKARIKWEAAENSKK
jgi:hypothetical protein